MAISPDDLQAIKSVVFSVVLHAEERNRKNLYRKHLAVQKEIKSVRKDLKATEERLQKAIQQEMQKEAKLLETVFGNLLRLEIGHQTQHLDQKLETLTNVVSQALTKTHERFEKLEGRIDAIDQRTRVHP